MSVNYDNASGLITLTQGWRGYAEFILPTENIGHTLYRKEFANEEEFLAFENKHYERSFRPLSMFRATLIPVRTDNWKDFAKDLFLPTFINHALKVDNIALRIFASIFALALDAIMFFPRLVCSRSRIKHIRNVGEHPVIPIIKNNEKFAEALSSGVIYMHLFRESVTIDGENAEHKKRDYKTPIYIRPIHSSHPIFNKYNKIVHKNENQNSQYQLVDGNWDQMGSVK